MKNFYLMILFIFIVLSSFAQTTDYKLTLDLCPSFISASQLNIESTQGSFLLDNKVYKNYRTKEIQMEQKAVLHAAKLSALTDFMKTYKFQIKNNIDTIGIHKEFLHGDSVLTYEISAGTDGINVSGIFSENGIKKKFAFWSPNKGTENAKLMALLFGLLDHTITDQQLIDYNEQLQDYFPHKLGIKKLGDKPLIYKLYGSISSEEEDELYKFLKSLPSHKQVIIDMSNYAGMGTMFYEVFNRYCAKKRNIYWRNPTSRGLHDLHAIGILDEQIMLKK